MSKAKSGCNVATVNSEPVLPNRPQSVSSLKFDSLIPYSKHPFKLYKGQRLEDMVESIRASGIISPLIVRPHAAYNGKFEILSGHNRINAARIAGYTETLCIVVGGLTDEEAHLYVTESNLVQRSFADLSHSERAAALASHYEAMKAQGKRNDLVSEIENLASNTIMNLNKSRNDGENVSSSEVRTKSRADKRVGEKYGLGKTVVAQYVRLNSLTDDFKALLDDGELSTSAGYSLSFLSVNQQNHLYEYIVENGTYGEDETIEAEGTRGQEHTDGAEVTESRNSVIPLKISMKQAEQIKQLATETKFSLAALDKIFQGKTVKSSKPKKTINIKYKRNQLSRYFTEADTDEDISNGILDALEFYRLYYDKAQPQPQPSMVSQQISKEQDYAPPIEPPKEGWGHLDKEAQDNINASLDAFFNM